MELKQEDVIRTKLSSGAIVGTFKVVDDVVVTGVYAHNIPLDALGSMFYNIERVAKVKSVVLQTTNESIHDVIENHLVFVEHPLNKSWEDALKEYLNSKVNEPIQAVTLKSTKSHIIVTEPVFRRVTCYGKVSIRLSFVRILEQIVR